MRFITTPRATQAMVRGAGRQRRPVPARRCTSRSGARPPGRGSRRARRSSPAPCARAGRRRSTAAPRPSTRPAARSPATAARGLSQTTRCARSRSRAITAASSLRVVAVPAVGGDHQHPAAQRVAVPRGEQARAGWRRGGCRRTGRRPARWPAPSPPRRERCRSAGVSRVSEVENANVSARPVRAKRAHQVQVRRRRRAASTGSRRRPASAAAGGAPARVRLQLHGSHAVRRDAAIVARSATRRPGACTRRRRLRRVGQRRPGVLEPARRAGPAAARRGPRTGCRRRARRRWAAAPAGLPLGGTVVGLDLRGSVCQGRPSPAASAAGSPATGDAAGRRRLRRRPGRRAWPVDAAARRRGTPRRRPRRRLARSWAWLTSVTRDSQYSVGTSRGRREPPGRR